MEIIKNFIHFSKKCRAVVAIQLKSFQGPGRRRRGLLGERRDGGDVYPHETSKLLLFREFFEQANFNSTNFATMLNNKWTQKKINATILLPLTLLKRPFAYFCLFPTATTAVNYFCYVIMKKIISKLIKRLNIWGRTRQKNVALP